MKEQNQQRQKQQRQKASGSLLQRLFRRGSQRQATTTKAKAKEARAASPRKQPAAASQGQLPAEATATAPVRKAPTRFERSIAEIKQMTRIGQKDPERLARLLTAVLAKERQKKQAEKERFEQQVLEIARRGDRQSGPDQGKSAG